MVGFENKTMKPVVLFFFDRIATGGAEKQTIQLAKELIKRGYMCHAIAYYSAHSPIIIDDEIRPYVHFVDGTHMRKIWEWPKAWAIIAQLQPDIVMTVNLSPLPIVVLGRLLGRFRVKIATGFHTTMFKTKVMRDTFPIVRMAMKFADRLIFVCQAQRAYWEAFSLFARKNVVIHNGVDVQRFAPTLGDRDRAEARACIGIAPDTFVIGMIAAFRPEKNHRQALEAVHRLRGSGVAVELLLVGEGVMLEACKRFADKLGVADAVHFIPNQADVRPFIQAIDVGLLCSITGETFSMAALEMMAMNVPMVMTRLSGAAEMIDEDRGGRLFEIGDTDELTAHLRDMCNPDLRVALATTAREIVETNFAEGVMVDKYDHLFTEIAAEA